MLAVHAGDRLVIGGRSVPRDDMMEALGNRLKHLPESVREPQRVELGVYRGLKFGLLLRPQGGPELFLEGAATRHLALSRDHHGPRAILNALDRLAAGYEAQLAEAKEDLSIAEAQLRDYQSRIGAVFAHEDYFSQLTHLRGRLKAVLSGTSAEEGGEPLPPAHELAEQIKSFKASHTIDAAPERISSRKGGTAAEPVTTRIRRKTGRQRSIPAEAADSDASESPADSSSAPVSAAKSDAALAEGAASQPAPGESEQAPFTGPKSGYQELVERQNWRKARQTSLF
ncbi:MAG TPA: hypothetical protein VMV10_01635 [Pirellulales bacterium]|nr:hypothetical protein [Pirellulales bacterium]